MLRGQVKLKIQIGRDYLEDLGKGLVGGFNGTV